MRWLATSFVACLVGCGDNARGTLVGERASVHALFIGNSLTYVNDVPAHWAALLEDSVDATYDTVAIGGYRLDQHAQDARTAGTQLAQLVGVDAPVASHFDIVVLQEQSWTAGDASDSAATAGTLELARLAQMHGAKVVLYETWAYKPGTLLDATFEAAERAIDLRFLDLAAYLREQGIDVVLAPVGVAFRIVRDEVIASGGDPRAPTSELGLLYEDDRHPTIRGAYLAACVIAGATRPVVVADFPDDPTLGAEVSDRLRDVCARALVAPRGNVPARLRPTSTIVTGAGAYSTPVHGLAVSADGNRFAVSYVPAPDAKARTDVYRRDASGWTRETSLDGGIVVRMNEAGDVLVAGPPARVWRRTASTWIEDAVYPQSPAWQSWTDVALSGNGNRLFASGWGAAPSQIVGFDWSGTTWETSVLFDHGPAMLATDTMGDGAVLGRDLVGDQVVDPSGYATKYGEPPMWYFEPAADIDATAVAMSGDGRVSAFVNPSSDLGVSLFVERQPALEVAHTGRALAISQHADMLVIGDMMASPVELGALDGAVYVYAKRDGAYRCELELLPPADEPAPTSFLDGISFGASVAITADMTHVFVHAPAKKVDGQPVGAVFEYVLPQP